MQMIANRGLPLSSCDRSPLGLLFEARLWIAARVYMMRPICRLAEPAVTAFQRTTPLFVRL